MADKIHRHVLISVMSNSQYLDINSAHLAFFFEDPFLFKAPKIFNRCQGIATYGWPEKA